MAIQINEALRVGLLVVGIGVDDLIGVGGTRGRDRQKTERQDESDAEASPQICAEGVQG